MSDIIKIKVITSTGFADIEHEEILEFDREYWHGLSDDEKEHECKDVAFEKIDWCWDELD